MKGIKEGFRVFKFLLFLHGNMFSGFPANRLTINSDDGSVRGDYFIPNDEAEEVYTEAFWEIIGIDYKELIK